MGFGLLCRSVRRFIFELVLDVSYRPVSIYTSSTPTPSNSGVLFKTNDKSRRAARESTLDLHTSSASLLHTYPLRDWSGLTRSSKAAFKYHVIQSLQLVETCVHGVQPFYIVITCALRPLFMLVPLTFRVTCKSKVIKAVHTVSASSDCTSNKKGHWSEICTV